MSLSRNSPIKQITLNGMQSNVEDHYRNDYKIWGGVRIKLDSPTFGLKRDGVTDWQAAYYNGQYFKMVPKLK